MVPEKYKSGRIFSGFRLTERRFVAEVNAECLCFEHEKSGARLIKIAADDPNKLFDITFKTLPANDRGAPHILEHAVLNGSAKFPVKSPFDVLLKGSLNTYMNAMTAPEHTTYPVASMNTRDYFNLMNVYLDAVFHPLVLTDNRILKQEGWHYELPSEESTLSIKGVVYNEMKGTFSNPLYMLYHLTWKHLFPDNVYGFSSGGHPDAIPLLTQNDLVDFHRKYYHPSNSYILIYGDACLDEELQFIDNQYLSAFSRQPAIEQLTPQLPFGSQKSVITGYAVAEGTPLKDNAYLSMSFAVNSFSDRTATLALDLLVNALVNHESAPLRLALEDAGIGREVMGWFTESQQNVITIVVPNANARDRNRFRKIICSTVERITREGFDRVMLGGLLNRSEFQLREGDTPQKGMMYLDLMMQGWLHENDPVSGLEYEKYLLELKEKLNTRYPELLLEQYILNNPHSLLLAMKPEAGLQTRYDNRLEKRLESIRKRMSRKQKLLLMNDTRELLQYQQEEDTPDALATVPMLQLSDIPDKARFYALEEAGTGDIQLLHYPQFTNGLVYVSLYFQLRALPEELIPYAALMPALLGKLSTAACSFGVLDNELNLHTGGFTSHLASYLENRCDENIFPRLVISSKARNSDTSKMLDLLTGIILDSRFRDKERLRGILTRHHAQIEANIRQNGMNYAITRAASRYSNRGMFNELTAGVEYYRFLTDLTGNFELKADMLVTKLEEVASVVFNKRNMIAQVTCSTEDLSYFRKEFLLKTERFPESPASVLPWKFPFIRLNEAILSASQVQYVVQGYDFRKLGYSWNGKIHVLSQVISTDWLQNQIRVMGGAYGGFCGFSPAGNVYFASYRDPNLQETLLAYKKTPMYLDAFSADDPSMNRYIIGTIAGLDQPKTPSQQGSAAMHHFFEKTTAEMLNQERQEILTTTPSDIRNLAVLVRDVLQQNCFCVYGNENRILANKDLFDGLIRLSLNHDGDNG